MFAALLGVWLAHGDNNVFVQVGLVVLMGLACKNAILIVEFGPLRSSAGSRGDLGFPCCLLAIGAPSVKRFYCNGQIVLRR